MCFSERVQFFIGFSFPLVPLGLCYKTELQVVQNALVSSFHYIFSPWMLMSFIFCGELLKFLTFLHSLALCSVNKHNQLL